MQDNLPLGSQYYGNQVYLDPDGKVWVGTRPNKFRQLLDSSEAGTDLQGTLDKGNKGNNISFALKGSSEVQGSIFALEEGQTGIQIQSEDRLYLYADSITAVSQSVAFSAQQSFNVFTTNIGMTATQGFNLATPDIYMEAGGAATFNSDQNFLNAYSRFNVNSPEVALNASNFLSINSPSLILNAIPADAGTEYDILVRDQVSGELQKTPYIAYLPLTGGVLSGDLQLPGIPVNGSSAITKGYLDNALTGITWKNAVRVKTTTNITLSGTQTIDGIALVSGNRVLVNNQTNATQNGIYQVNTGAWTRVTDADSGEELETATVAVTAGSAWRNTQWTSVTSSPIIVGTTPISFGQISGAGTYTNGTGLLLSGNVFSIDPSYKSTNYIYNDPGNLGPQSASFSISGSGKINSTLYVGGSITGNSFVQTNGGFGNSPATGAPNDWTLSSNNFVVIQRFINTGDNKNYAFKFRKNNPGEFEFGVDADVNADKVGGITTFYSSLRAFNVPTNALDVMRLTDMSAYTPGTGGNGYIQNTTIQQALSNFNISGQGIADSYQASGVNGFVAARIGGTGQLMSTSLSFFGDGSGGYSALKRVGLEYQATDTSFKQYLNFAPVTGGNKVITLPDATGTVALLADIPANGTFINNQTTQQATSNFNISGTGQAAAFTIVNTAGTLNPMNISIAGNGGIVINRTGTQPGSINLQVLSSGAMQLGASTDINLVTAAGTAGSIAYFNGTNKTVGLGTTSPTHTLTLSSISTGIAHYNTTDQTTNYERVREYWAGNRFNIDVESANTGTPRDLRLSSANAVNSIILSGGRGIQFSTNSGGDVQSGHYGLGGTYNGSGSVNQKVVGITPTIAQTGTTSYNALYISVFESTIGTGTSYFINAGNSSSAGGIGHTSKFTVDTAGQVTAAGSLRLGTNNSPITNTNAQVVYGVNNGVGATGVYPFQVNGNLVLQGRNQDGADIVFMGGSTVAVKAFLTGGTGNFHLGYTAGVDQGYKLAVNGTALISGPGTSFTVNGNVLLNNALTVVGDSNALTASIGGNKSGTVNTGAGSAFRIVSGTYTDTASIANAVVLHNITNSFAGYNLAATNTGVTYSNASTVYISGPPVASTNATITNPWALFVNSGGSYFNGRISVNVGGILVNSGTSTFNGSVIFGQGATLNSAAGTVRDLVFSSNNISRFTFRVDATAETGANVGSNFQLISRDDAGTAIATLINIERSTSKISINGATVFGAGLSSNNSINITSPAGTTRQLALQTNQSNRWLVRVESGAESGGNAGSDFAIYRADDTGSTIGAVLAANRSTGVVSIPALNITTMPSTDNSTNAASTAFVKSVILRVPSNNAPASMQTIVNNKYVADSSSLVVFTMPTEGNSAIGDQVLFRGRGTGLWQVKFNTGQVAHGASDTTSGGTISSQSRYDTLALEKIAANEWSIIANRGTLTIA